MTPRLLKKGFDIKFADHLAVRTAEESLLKIVLVSKCRQPQKLLPNDRWGSLDKPQLDSNFYNRWDNYKPRLCN